VGPSYFHVNLSWSISPAMHVGHPIYLSLVLP
jgi:hypothetical protein